MLLSLIALALAVYIGLVFILLDAIQHQPLRHNEISTDNLLHFVSRKSVNTTK